VQLARPIDWVRMLFWSMSSRYRQSSPPGSPQPPLPDTTSSPLGVCDIAQGPPESLTYPEYLSTLCSKDFIQAFAGACSGLASGIVTCPLDVIKTKLQAQGGFRVRRMDPISIGQPLQYRGLVGTAQTIWREDGLRGMYRGLGPITMGYIPTWVVYFTIYNRSKEYFGQKVG
jgi:solute carrier family 25 folate transporter 32